MTEVVGYSSRGRAAAPAAPGSTDRAPRRRQSALVLAVACAAGAGWLLAAASAAPAPLQDAELAMLLRFMAVMKMGIALSATGVTAWRFGHPMSLGCALPYGAGCLLMSAAPGVIWHLSAVGTGAALFHTGLVLWLAALAIDHAATGELVRRAFKARRPTPRDPHAR